MGRVCLRVQGKSRLFSVARSLPVSPNFPWRNSQLRHVVDSKEFERECLDMVFEVAEEMERVKPGTLESKQLEGYCMATLFYEPSTRTRLSFEAAMGKLGGVILSTESAGQFSSAAKGETLEGASGQLAVGSIQPFRYSFPGEVAPAIQTSS
jgi:hypothetical protein